MTVSFRVQRVLTRIYLRYISCVIYLLAGISLLFLNKPAKPLKKLLILKPDAAGDYILVRNFLRILRNSEKYRDYHITFCGNAVYRELVEQFDGDCFDDHLWLRKNRIYLDIFYYMRIARSIAGQFSVVIHPVFSREFLFDYFAKIAGVEERIGFMGDAVNINPVYSRFASSWYTRLINIDHSVIFEVDRNRIFFETILEKPAPVVKPFFELGSLEKVKLMDVDGKLAVIFPGAQLSFRKWPASKFAVISDFVHREYGVKVVIAGGPDDTGIAAEIAGLSEFPLINLAGKTRFPQLIRLISQSSLLVTNDTVAVHIGAALNIPMVVVSQMNHYGRFVPYPVAAGCNMACVVPGNYEKMDPVELHAKFINGSTVEIASITTAQVSDAIIAVMTSAADKSFKG